MITFTFTRHANTYPATCIRRKRIWLLKPTERPSTQFYLFSPLSHKIEKEAQIGNIRD